MNSLNTTSSSPVLAHTIDSHIPFNRNVQVSSLFESSSYQEGLARLNLMVEHHYLGVLTGDVGAGKSTMIRRLVDSLDAMRYQPVYLSIGGLKPRDFYGELLRLLGEIPPYAIVKAKQLWGSILNDRYTRQDRTLVIIIDEAQDLSEQMLLELRFVMNYNMDSVSLFPLILVGQPELRRTLRLRKYQSIAQRVQLQYHLGGLTQEETAAYIRHQMKMAGVNSPVFSESAINSIYGMTKGIPRLINHLCTQTLYDAACKKHEVIEEQHIGRVLADYDRQQGTAG